MSFIAQCLVMFALFGCSSLLRRKSVLEMFPEYMDFKAEIRENINALKEEKPAFQAYLSNNQTFSFEAYVNFDNVKLDNFNAYNRTSGTFVCPMTGIYAIGCVIDAAALDGSFRLMKNASPIAQGDLKTESVYIQNVVISLSKGDRLNVMYRSKYWFLAFNPILIRAKLFGDYRTSFHLY